MISAYNYKPIAGLQGQNSYLYLLKFPTAVAENDRIYLDMDSQIDDGRITGIETHYYQNIGGVYPWDFPATILIDGLSYNVITVTELTNMTLTLVDKKRSQVLSQFPFANLRNKYTGTNKAKTLKKFDLDILTGESYVTFNFNSVVAAPFVAPITFYFDDKNA